MPLYELFCLARPQLPRAKLAGIIRTAGTTVLDNGGVLRSITSFGDEILAYDIRKSGQKFDQAAMWQMSFKAAPSVLPALDHNLRVDEQVLRWMVFKRRQDPRLPTTSTVAKLARQFLELDKLEATRQSAVQQGLQQPAAEGARAE